MCPLGWSWRKQMDKIPFTNTPVSLYKPHPCQTATLYNIISSENVDFKFTIVSLNYEMYWPKSHPWLEYIAKYIDNIIEYMIHYHSCFINTHIHSFKQRACYIGDTFHTYRTHVEYPCKRYTISMLKVSRHLYINAATTGAAKLLMNN